MVELERKWYGTMSLNNKNSKEKGIESSLEVSRLIQTGRCLEVLPANLGTSAEKSLGACLNCTLRGGDTSPAVVVVWCRLRFSFM